jgi:crossover junction endodeoxyribonuclease RusA
MNRLTLTLPLPPSINHQYATVQGRRVLSAAGRRYKKEVCRLALLGLACSPSRQDLLQVLRSHYLALSIRFHFASPLRRDVDGGLKITQDALCEALGLNDSRVFEIHLYKNFSSASPGVEVILSPAVHGSVQSLSS